MADLREVKTDEYTINSGHLEVGNGHKVYFEKWGNAKAKTPILFFHGGPGYHYSFKHKEIFDYKSHQVIFFDQRGCGNSLPYGKLLNNSTQDLISDAIKILEFLNIKRAYVYGTSWGSTLALLFSIKYQKITKSTVVQAVFTGSQSEIDYIDKGLFKDHYPEVWERFANSVPKSYVSNPADFHYKTLQGTSKNKLIASAKALRDLESPLLRFEWRGYPVIANPDYDPNKPDEEYDYMPTQIFAHYLSNSCFLTDNYIFNNALKIKSPLYIVQGRYDMVCPPISAYRLHNSIFNSKLFMTSASHTDDPENRTALKILIETVFI